MRRQTASGSRRPAFRRLAQLQQRNQIQTDHCVIERLLALLHRILIVAEQRESRCHELVESLLGIGRRDGKPEGLDVAEMLAEAAADEVDNVAGDRVGLEARWLRRMHPVGQGPSVLGVQVPFPA